MENLIVDLRRRNAGLMQLKVRLPAGILAGIKAHRDVDARRRLLLSLPGFCPVVTAKTATSRLCECAIRKPVTPSRIVTSAMVKPVPPR